MTLLHVMMRPGQQQGTLAMSTILYVFCIFAASTALYGLLLLLSYVLLRFAGSPAHSSRRRSSATQTEQGTFSMVTASDTQASKQKDNILRAA